MDKQPRTMLFNPYNGKPRDPRDIASDPAGALMTDPDEPLYAASKAQPPSASDELLRLMPEVLAALRSPGPNVSLVRDVEKALAARSPAASAEYDPAFPFYELRFIMRVLSHEGSAPKEDWQTAYGMARAVFERWSKDRAAVPAASADEWMAEAEKLADEYAKSFHDAVNGPSYARKLSRAALLAHLKTRN